MGSAHSKNDTHGNGNVALQERSDDILVPKMNHQLSTKAKGRDDDQVEVLKILVKEITNDLIIEKEKNKKLEEEKKQLQDSLKEATTTAKKDATSLETDDDDDTSLQTNDDDVASNHRMMARHRSRWILPPILASRSLNPTLRRALDEAEEMSLKAMEPPSDEYFKKYLGINIDDTDNDDDDSDDNDDTFVQCEINDNGTNDDDDTDDDDDEEEEET